jgi:hypothetical protein
MKKTKTTQPSPKKSSKKSTTSATAPGSTPTPITASHVAQCQSLLDGIDGILGPVTQLSADDIRRSLKLRKGGAQVVTQLAALCNHHQVTSVGPVTVNSMIAEKTQADTLNEIGVQFAAVAKKLSDATFSAESSTWQQATALYTVLQRLALMDPTLAAGLQPVQAFFQTSRTRNGGQRVAQDIRTLKKAQKLASKYQASSTESAAPPAASSNIPLASASASNEASVSAPVAATPVTTSPVVATPAAATPVVAAPAAATPVAATLAATNSAVHS